MKQRGLIDLHLHLDGSFSGLDPVNAMLLKDVVKDQISIGKIVIFSSHQMNYIEEFCDSIAIINSGKVVVSGDLYDIKRNYPRNKLVVSSIHQNEIKKEYSSKCSCFDDGRLILTLDSEDDKKRVMSDIVNKYDVDEIKVYEPSLNDIFVEFAKDKV